MSKPQATEFLIIGAGIIGLTIAQELKRRYPDSRVIILEKENQVGQHASGRNSGVLHAGFYYTKDSLKAKFTKLGNAALTEYCLANNIPIHRCGKLVVARHAEDLIGMQELFQRGKQNNIDLAWVTDQEAREIEPRVKTFQQALFSKTTASVDPKRVMQHLYQAALQAGIIIHLGVKYVGFKKNVVLTNQGQYTCEYLINAAGLYADKVARDFGFSKDYSILPFKGLYLYASSPAEKLNTHIYPVPELHHPFLGVHFSLTVDGIVKLGPTAMPAFWREQYQGLANYQFKEMLEILRREIGLLFSAGFDFKGLAWREIQKYQRRILVQHAAQLIQGVDQKNYQHWGKPGIRAQLLNLKTRQLEMDFILEGDDRSLHVLNAVSPAFTCSMPFAGYVVDQMLLFKSHRT